jgi:ankyrin repeat protein
MASEALLAAVREDDRAAVSRLLAAGADPNSPVAGRQLASEKAFQTTALIAAAVNGRLEAARLLLEGGTDPNRVNSNGFTPLMVAAENGHVEVLRLLLARGAAADALAPADNFTAFHMACFHNHPDCAEALLRAGCDTAIIETRTGNTAEQYAEGKGNKAVLRRLRGLARQPFVGVVVELAGLVGAAEHNGKRATVRPRFCSPAYLEPLALFCLSLAA